jgi:hypothetical protein
MSLNSGLPASRQAAAQPSRQPTNLADLLERVLDKGIIIAGDIKVNLLDIELLTIKIRLLVASVDKAQEMGIDWWRNDPMLSSSAGSDVAQLTEENRQLRDRIEALEAGRSEPRPVDAQTGVAEPAAVENGDE